MKRIAKFLLAAVATATSLTGCVVYDGYDYYEDDYYDSRPAYSYGSRYDTSYRYASYAPDYVYWSDYYSVLWPTYRYYYDPVFSPHFYYGVTWFPVSYFGLHYSRYQWPYYHAYAPYRYSYWDNYYDWRWRSPTVYSRPDGRYNYNYGQGYYPRYGSARNEAERIAAYNGLSRVRGLATPGVQVQPYSAETHVFGWRNDGVRGHYPQQEGPQPYFRNTRGADPLDWRQANRYNRMGEPDDGGAFQGGAGAEAYRIQRGSGWDQGNREPVQSGADGRGNPRQSGWVGSFPEPRNNAPAQRPQRDDWSNRGTYPSTRGNDPPPARFEQPTPREEPRRFEREPVIRQEYREPTPQRESRFDGGNRFERPQSSPQRYEAPQRYQAPQRYEAPQRSEPRFERQFSQPRYEAPQRSEPRFEAPQRSEPRFEAPQRSEPPSRGDDGGAAREAMRISRGGDREE